MIHIVTGAPCSGKSTYVAKNAAEGDVIVDYDKIAVAIGSSKPHDAVGHIRSAAFKAREAIISYLLDNSDNAEGWIIHTKPTQEQTEAYENAGAEFITIEATMEECLERAEADDRPARVFDAIRAYFEGRKGAKMKRRIKTIEAKAENGSIRGYAATFTREPDSYGDVIAKGAFQECIERLKAEGRVLPLLWNHDSCDLSSFIGTVAELKEDDHGLMFDATFDDTQEAQRARELAIDGRLCKFSFAYDVLEAADVTLEDGRKAYELRKLNIHEVSLVMYPANPDTGVVEVKGADEKSGRRNSKADAEQLREVTELLSTAQSIINSLLADEEGSDDEAGAKSEERDTVNDEERKRRVDLIKKANEILKKGEQ